MHFSPKLIHDNDPQFFMLLNIVQFNTYMVSCIIIQVGADGQVRFSVSIKVANIGKSITKIIPIIQDANKTSRKIQLSR